MNTKTVIAFGVGTTAGFITCGVIGIKKIISSNEMKKAVTQIITNKIEKLLYGNTIPRRTNSRLSYSRYYQTYKSDYGQQESKLDHNDIIFDTRSDAEAVLDALENIIGIYGQAFIIDYYELCGVTDYDYAASKYGWTDITKASINRVNNGYLIKMPKATKIK